MSNELVVFPTELALRRYQQQVALKEGWVDASRHLTFSRLRKLCMPYAAIKGRQMDPAQKLLMRRQVVEVASGHFSGQGALGDVSPRALGDILDQLVTELASLPGETYRIIEWLLGHQEEHKLYQLGTLISIWRASIKQDGWADAIDVNQAILQLLRGNRQKWPPVLRECGRIVFKAVRWFNPFEESCVSALNQTLKVRVESALPGAHAEAAADRLGLQIRSEIMAEPWSVWAEDLGDALAVDSADLLQLGDAGRIHFSRSAGAYGEIEDLARRICRHLESSNVDPGRIALIVPNIGTVQDIVPHVFSRFGIPYYFRRGRPVLSSPVVKSYLALLAFPIRAERDALIDLMRNPSLQFEGGEDQIEFLQRQPPLLELSKAPIRGLWTSSVPGQAPGGCSCLDALRVLTEQVVAPSDHFNAEALKAVSAALESFGSLMLPLNELVDLLEELLQDATVRPEDSHEQGVWILNPHDAVGMEFDLILFAGLNEGEFPGIPQQDALLSDSERFELRRFLEAQGRHLPKLALPMADVLFEQQSVLFLSALGMAREQLLFSYQSVDQEGNEKGASEYYRKVWNLAGWPVSEEMVLSPYDEWRIKSVGPDNMFSAHLAGQLTAGAEDRAPMPGESFLPIIPLPLCRAPDEALQAAVQQGSDCVAEAAGTVSSGLTQLVEKLKIEAERDAFLDAAVEERNSSVFCGHIGGLKAQVAEWFEARREMSPTALETLAHNRYVFLIERVFGVRDPRVADDTPDPMDRGGLIHSILHKIYNALALGQSGIDAPRYWAVKTDQGWMRRTEPGLDAVPLAVFLPELKSEYTAFAKRIAEQMMDASELGHPGVWAAEREKILQMVLNFVRYDADTCRSENRFPALFEVRFGRETGVELEVVRLHGIIDRVDLVFEESNLLKKIRVLDYKGTSKARRNAEEYVSEIVRNLDCQLPVYAFAAQQHFFGDFNTDELNALTETGYLIYQRKLKDIAASLKKSLIPMNADGLVCGFLETLRANIGALKAGDFSVDPLIETYTDYRSVCRTVAVSLDQLD